MTALTNLATKLSELLTPYRYLIGPLASVATVAQFVAEGIIIKEVSTKKSTKGTSSWPFIGGLVVGTLMVIYSFMIEDFNMFVINFSAILFNSFYTFIYNKYCRNKKKEIKTPLFWGSVLTFVVFMYSLLEKEEAIGYRYGVIMSALMMIIMGTPLLDVKEMLRKEDPSKIPVPLTMTTTLVCFLWFLYGFIIKSDFMVIQNLIGVIVCLVQVVIYIVLQDRCGVTT